MKMRYLPQLLLALTFQACLSAGAQDREFNLKLDLDTLLTPPAVWELTPDALEQKVNKDNFKENPYYKWLDSSRSSARFTRRPFGNVFVDLSLFGGKAAVEEAIIEFKDGKAAQVTLSLYNRGDSGEISKPQFEERYKIAGGALGQLLGVRPQERRATAQTAVKTSGWLWTSPHTLALLEYNEDALKKPAAAEFLRLRLTTPASKDKLLNIAAIGQSTTTLSRSDLPKFVKREANGDVYVGGIPMVDQGEKGYCVVASCQRLFGYLNIPCDQHELAQVAGSDSERGTNSRAFSQALGKIDNKFKVRFKPLLEKYPMEPTDAKEARPDRFLKMLQDHIDRGVPLLWALQLGNFPEEPDNGAQSGGGHMRLIIGYNTKQDQLLFSDSWGAGHELKRMNMSDAIKATFGVYLLEPKAR